MQVVPLEMQDALKKKGYDYMSFIENGESVRPQQHT